MNTVVEVAPGIHAVVQERPYEVVGASSADFLKEMEAKGPFTEGKRRWAFTDAKVKYDFKTYGDGKICRLTEVIVDVTADEILPQWQDCSRASAALVQEWVRFTAAVRDHEQGHIRIAFDTAKAVVRAIQGVGTRPSCDELNRAIREAGDAPIARRHDQDVHFDVETKHGETTGALLGYIN